VRETAGNGGAEALSGAGVEGADAAERVAARIRRCWLAPFERTTSFSRQGVRQRGVLDVLKGKK
jgi:hypothetical protein